MKLDQLTCIVVAMIAALVLPSASLAQWLDAEGNPVFNPGDTNPVTPKVTYFCETGILWLDTTGLNRIADTTNGSTIGGDDVGFISMVLEGPEPKDFLLEGLHGTDGVGTNWTAQYFNGKFQLFAATLTEQFLMPIGTTRLARYPTGLTPEDFPGFVELGVNLRRVHPVLPFSGRSFFVLLNQLLSPFSRLRLSLCPQSCVIDSMTVVSITGTAQQLPISHLRQEPRHEVCH